MKRERDPKLPATEPALPGRWRTAPSGAEGRGSKSAGADLDGPKSEASGFAWSASELGGFTSNCLQRRRRVDVRLGALVRTHLVDRAVFERRLVVGLGQSLGEEAARLV